LQAGLLLAERYHIEHVLGRGGMGAVYLATDQNLGTHVAVKENLNVSPESERLFKREATLLASLRHHHLPRVTNHFVLSGQQYLVMDYVEGEDLKERLARLGPLPEAEVKRWAAQICDALNYMHALTPPVVHRDIKPANIRINSLGEAILVDFGIAKLFSSDSNTTTNTAAFTPGYAPPEQYGMGRTEPRTDQYALGATLYTLLTGQTPPDSMERLLGNATLQAPAQLRPGLSPTFSAAIVRALEVQSESRFESIAVFKAMMLGTATRLPAAPKTVEAEPPAPPAPVKEAPPRRSLAPLAMFSGVVLKAGLALGAAFLGGLLPLGASVVISATSTLPFVIAGPVATSTFVVPPTSTATAPPVTPTLVPPSQTPDEAATVTLVPPTPDPAAGLLGGGGRLAFISNRDNQYFQVYTMMADGSDVQQLTFDERNKWSAEWQLGRLGPLSGGLLAWSPDGAQLLYTAEVSPGGAVDLWVINADGSNPVNLTAPTRAGQPNENDYHPVWCNDGAIAFTSIRNNYPQIFITTLDDRAARNYSTVRSNVVEYNPVFFPDCRRMLVISTQNGAGELWRIFPFNAAALQMWAQFPPVGQFSYRSFLSELPQGNVIFDAALSPDGTLVAYTRSSPGSVGRNIVVATVEDSQLTMKFQQLTEARSDTAPQWSPDGKYLVFVSKRDGGNPQIFRMFSGGSDEVNLSANSFTELSPVWQPQSGK
ncbi:MAG: protein kinase domain-containing protein, partial [Anaerolineales bacterium]